MKRSQQRKGLFFRSENRFLVRKGFLFLYFTENTVNIQKYYICKPSILLCGICTLCEDASLCWCNKKAEQPIASHGGQVGTPDRATEDIVEVHRRCHRDMERVRHPEWERDKNHVVKYRLIKIWIRL